MTGRQAFEEEPFEGEFPFEDEFEILGEEEYEDEDLEELFEVEGDLEPLGSEAEEAWLGEVNRRSREYKKWVQRSLNQILGTRLAIDGIIGRRTRSAVRTFQRRAGTGVDGIVGSRTERALIRAGASPPRAGKIARHAPAPTAPPLVPTRANLKQVARHFEEETFEGAFAFEDEFEILGEEEFEDEDLESLFEFEGDLEPLGFEAEEGGLSAAKVRRAVRLNRRYGKKLGWDAHYDQLGDVLGVDYRQNKQTFAQAVADWQQRVNIKPDGIIGRRTWRWLQTEIGRLETPLPTTSWPTENIWKKPAPAAVEAFIKELGDDPKKYESLLITLAFHPQPQYAVAGYLYWAGRSKVLKALQQSSDPDRNNLMLRIIAVAGGMRFELKKKDPDFAKRYWKETELRDDVGMIVRGKRFRTWRRVRRYQIDAFLAQNYWVVWRVGQDFTLDMLKKNYPRLTRRILKSAAPASMYAEIGSYLRAVARERYKREERFRILTESKRRRYQPPSRLRAPLW